MQDLGTLPGDLNSTATSINNSGQVVGWSQNSSSSQHAFLYNAGTMQNLGTLPGDLNGSANSVNNSGQVVGWSSGGYVRAFLYTGGTMEDLNNLAPASSGWKLETANAINNKGQIVGFGVNSAGQGDAFLGNAYFDCV